MTFRYSATLPADFDAPPPNATLPALTAEICERLREMEEAKRHAGAKLIGGLFRLSCESIPAFHLVLAAVSSPSDAITTYQSQAEARGVSRQAIHQEMPQLMAIIRSHFPEIADHIERLRHAAHANYQGHA